MKLLMPLILLMLWMLFDGSSDACGGVFCIDGGPFFQ